MSPSLSPPGNTQRMTAVTLAGFCAFLGLYSPQPLLPLLQEVFGLDTSGVSLLITVSTFAVAAAAPFVGLLADRYGRRRTIVLASLAITVPITLAAAATSFKQILAWRILQGLLTPAISATTVAYISEEWAEQWRNSAGRAMSNYVAGTVFGGFAGRIVCSFVAAAISWRAAFGVLGAVNLLAGFAILLWLPPDSRSHTGSGRRGGSTILAHLRNPQLLATYGVGFCVLFTMIAAFTYVNFYLAAPPFRWDTKQLGLLFTVYLVGAASTMSSGRAMDRYGPQRLLLFALIVSMAGILLTLIPVASAVIAGLAVCCSGAFVAQAAANSYIGLAAKHDRGAAVGIYVTAYYLGGSTGAALPGLFWNWGGWQACVALVAAVLAITIGVAGIFLRQVPRRLARTSPATDIAPSGGG